MGLTRPERDIAEIFGRDPTDCSQTSHDAWKTGTCPFTGAPCTKTNHDRTLTYGTCVLSAAGRLVVVCPKRFYGAGHHILKTLGAQHFPGLPVLDFDEYRRSRPNAEVAVLLGQGSGREVSAGNMSLDWVIARASAGRLVDFVVIEVQSIDITGNYRDCWDGYRRFRVRRSDVSQIPPGEFGFNWANVHKRIIPQLLRKSLLIQKAGIQSRGIELLLPDQVFAKFDEVMGFSSLQNYSPQDSQSIRVRSYALGASPGPTGFRELTMTHTVSTSFESFSARFISSTGPSGVALGVSIQAALVR